MKTKTILILALALSLLLVACTGGAVDVESLTGENELSQSTVDDQGNDRNTDEDSLPVNQLLFGVIQLEGTEQAVTTEQAAELIPLYKALNALASSDTAAVEEIAAVQKQIQAILTVEQVTALSEIEITPEEQQALFEELGIELRAGLGNRPDGENDSNFQPPAGGQAGQRGGPGGGGPGGQSDVQLSPEQQETAEALRAERLANDGGGFINPSLIEAVIDILEGK